MTNHTSQYHNPLITFSVEILRICLTYIWLLWILYIYTDTWFFIHVMYFIRNYLYVPTGL